MQCVAVDKIKVGRREFWTICRLALGHSGKHHDPKRPHHYWTETFRAFEFETGRKIKMPTKKKERLCRQCCKQQRTDGANDVCVCKEIGATQRQGIMFASDRERIEREHAAKDMQDDIEWITAIHAEMIEERCEYYRGEF